MRVAGSGGLEGVAGVGEEWRDEWRVFFHLLRRCRCDKVRLRFIYETILNWG